jgi:hypothetical protein
MVFLVDMPILVRLIFQLHLNLFFRILRLIQNIQGIELLIVVLELAELLNNYSAKYIKQ